MRSISAALAAILLLPAALAAQDPQPITPSITLMPHVDPINDTDHSSLMVTSTEGMPLGTGLGLDWRCYGRQYDVALFFPAIVTGWSRVIWRFDSAPPDTLPLADVPLRAYGRPGAWLVVEKPMRLVPIPDSVKAAFTRQARGARRLVVRLDGLRAQRDWFFDLQGLSRGLDRLSCVANPAPPAAAPPRVLGQPAPLPEGRLYYEPNALDALPVPVDSAAAAAAVLREVPPAALRDPVVGEILAFVEIDAEGVVDTVDVASLAEREVEAAVVRALSSIRFTPARSGGKAVPARIAVYVQARDPREEMRMP